MFRELRASTNFVLNSTVSQIPRHHFPTVQTPSKHTLTITRHQINRLIAPSSVGFSLDVQNDALDRKLAAEFDERDVCATLDCL